MLLGPGRSTCRREAVVITRTPAVRVASWHRGSWVLSGMRGATSGSPVPLSVPPALCAFLLLLPPFLFLLLLGPDAISAPPRRLTSPPGALVPRLHFRPLPPCLRALLSTLALAPASLLRLLLPLLVERPAARMTALSAAQGPLWNGTATTSIMRPSNRCESYTWQEVMQCDDTAIR